jgi:hypothetical protein
LAPLFLIGLGAIALPVWLHRLQTQSPEREPFGSAMFLEPSERRVHLKKEFRYLILLALRILLLALLAFAFAKPILQRPSPVIAGQVPTLHLIVIDTSLSMGHGDRLARAKRTALELINAKAVGDQTQIISAGGSIEIAAQATNNTATARQAVAALEPGAGRLDLGELVAGLGSLVGAVEQNIAIHLVSDFQASGLPARFGDLVPGPINQRAVELILHPVVAGDAANFTVEFIRETATGVDVGVRGFATGEQQQELALSINGVRHGKQTQTVPAAGQAVYSFDTVDYEPGDNRIEATLTPNDLLAVDDTRYAVVDNTPPAPVLLITTSKQSLPVTYLSVALATGPRGYRAEPVTVAELDPRVLQRYPWIVIDDLGAIDENLARAITAYLNAGGAVLSALGERAVARKRLPVTGHRVGDASIVGMPAGIAALRSVDWIDASHPALARTRGWRSVNVSRALPLVVGGDDRVLMTLDDEQPLLLEHRRGDGRLLLLTTRLDNSWTDLPVHPVFVSFIAEAAAYLADEAVLDRQQRVGASLVLKQTRGASGQVVDPTGRTVLKLADTRRTQDVRLDQTGFYEVYTPGREALVAVNTDPRESDLATMSPDALARWRDAVARREPAATASGTAALHAPPLELWRGLLIVLALVVLAESLLGNRYLGLRADAS